MSKPSLEYIKLELLLTLARKMDIKPEDLLSREESDKNMQYIIELENEILKRLDEKEDKQDEIAGIKVPLKNLL